ARPLQRSGFGDFRAMDPPSAWDSAIPERWTVPAREISLFPSGGPLPRVGFRDSRAVDSSSAWDFVISERWDFRRAGVRDSRAVDLSRAGDSTISERWTSPARGNARFLSDSTITRAFIFNRYALELRST